MKSGIRARTAFVLVSMPVLAGCALIDSDIDRGGYFAAREQLSSTFAPNGEPGPAFVSGAPGLPMVDAASAEQVLLSAAGEIPGYPRDVAIRFLARSLTDPALVCSTNTASPLHDLIVPELGPTLAAMEAAGDLYVQFPGCSADGIGELGYPDIRVGGTEVAFAYTSDGGALTWFRSEVTYLFGTPDGVVPFTQLWIGSFNTGRYAPFPIYGINLQPLYAGWGLGSAGLPDPEAFSPGPEQSAGTAAVGDELVDPVAATEVVRALAITLSAGSIQAQRDLRSLTEDGESSTTPHSTGAGVIFPGIGGAELAIVDGGGPAGLKILAERRQFTEALGPLPPSGNRWSVYDTSRAANIGDGQISGNVFSLFDWLTHLRAAWPIDCDDLLTGDRCYAVEVPVERLLAPGAAGFRDAMVAAASGQQVITLAVGVRDGVLSALRTEELHAPRGLVDSRIQLTYQLTGYNEVAVPPDGVLPPPGFVA